MGPSDATPSMLHRPQHRLSYDRSMPYADSGAGKVARSLTIHDAHHHWKWVIGAKPSPNHTTQSLRSTRPKSTVGLEDRLRKVGDRIGEQRWPRFQTAMRSEHSRLRYE